MQAKPLLLDGGMGQELVKRGVTGDAAIIWSANGLVHSPEIVQAIHEDYIRAGADIITTNTYSSSLDRLRKAGIGDKLTSLNEMAGQLAQQARDVCGRDVLIAASFAPLRPSYRQDLVTDYETMVVEYQAQVTVLAPFVDILLFETLTTGIEGKAAAVAASSSGKPIWISWNLSDDGSTRLRSGETITEASALLDGLGVEGILLNCCPPEAITAAMGELAALNKPIFGGYANGFVAVPDDWRVEANGLDVLGTRQDLDPVSYAEHAQTWLDNGATVVGGCCEVGPAHIGQLRALI